MEKYFSKATLDEVFDKMTIMFGNKVSIIFEDQKITYTDLRKQSYNLAVKLRKLGVAKDTKVAILLPNCCEYLCIYFANFILGSNAVPINSRMVKQELFNILNDCGVHTLFVQDVIGVHNYDKMISELRSELPMLKHVIVRGNSNEHNVMNFADLFSLDDHINSLIESFEHPDISEDDVALLAYTSGTTSTPKGVMITHQGLVNTSYYAGEIWELTYDKVEEDCIALSVAPLFGAQGFLAVLIDLVCGITMNWLSTFNPNEIIKSISKGEASVFHTQPTMWSLLLSSPLMSFANFDKLSKTVVSGSLCSYNLAKKIQDRTNSLVLNAYGLIEATGVVTMTRLDDPEDIRLNTVGRKIPGVEIKIVDSDRKEVPHGEVGEIATQGYLMKGYYNNDIKTKEVIDSEGWLYTGDLGRYYNGTENIQIVGRSKEMIIRGGFNIYPIDIEEQLLNHALVQDASVVGRYDEILGESIVAYIVSKPGTNLSKGNIIKHCKELLSNHKIPDEVYFLKQLPTILNGKVQKTTLSDWAVNGVPEEEIHYF